MVFGVFIDAPLLTGTFVLMMVFRKRLTGAVVRLGLPVIVLYALTSIPLIIF